jgi:hypothetical protein
MNKLPEPDHVDFCVGGVEPDPQASIDTLRKIEEYKQRPTYQFETQEAERILAEVGIELRRYGMQNAELSLEHWHRCIADLTEAGQGDANGVNGNPDTNAGDGVGSSPKAPQERM